jgi:thiamine biosynthesis lipoprotein
LVLLLAVPGWARASALGLAALAACASERLRRHEFVHPAMGTEFRYVLFAPDRRRAEDAFDAARRRVLELDALLSDYDPGSELSRLGARSDGAERGVWVPVSPELFALLAEGRRIHAASAGAFDVTVGPYTRLWRRAGRQGALPEEARLAAAGHCVGSGLYELDPARSAVRLGAAGMRFDLGGIAKGFALDEALRELAARGVPRALVDGGGDVAAGAPPPGRSAWSVAIAGLDSADPRRDRAGRHVPLAHGALATSGDLERGFTLAGVRYSHLLDPRSGRALEGARLASVRAPTATAADAWATALAVLGPAGLAAVEREAGQSGRIAWVGADGAVRAAESAAFARGLCSRELLREHPRERLREHRSEDREREDREDDQP